MITNFRRMCRKCHQEFCEEEIAKRDLKEELRKNIIIPLIEFGLSVRAHNCLINTDIKTLNDLLACPKEKIFSIKNLGLKCLWEIYFSLKEIGIEPHFDPKERYLSRKGYLGLD